MKHDSSVQTLAVLALGGTLLAAGACDKSNESKPPEQTEAGAQAKTDQPAQPTEPTPAAEPGDAEENVKVVEGAPPGKDDRYELSIDTPEAKVGEEGKVTVKVVPKDPWHMNLDFPTSLKVEPPEGVQVAKAEQKKADAVTLDENSAQFDVAFTPTGAGDKTFTGKFKFAVCQDEACSPVTEDVEFKVAVK